MDELKQLFGIEGSEVEESEADDVDTLPQTQRRNSKRKGSI